MVGKDITLAYFKFIVEEFLKKFFAGQKIEFRFRPSYFPFVEPGVEVDIKLKGKWLEIMGAGMVRPRVFEYARYNPKDWQGFAFGVGLDRLAMIKYGVPDIRLFYSGDLRFLKQF
jgi:phenylalanyl-tRNA synthetase alpha chain